MNPSPDTSHPIFPSPDPEKKNADSENGSTTHKPQGWVARVEASMHDPRRRPLLIALGPFPILCFIWTFFVVTFIKPVALPDYFAPIVRDHFQSATMVASIVATVIASQASFFFSLAVRYVIAIRLVTRPTSLDVLTSVTRIAQKGLWFHDPRFKWTWIALLAYVGVSVQTSALTSFLAVREIPIMYNLKGHDFNMSDPQSLGTSNARLSQTYNTLASYFLQSVMVDAMQLRRNIPTAFNFNGYTYLSNTGGIHPATYVPVQNEEFTTNFSVVVPANLNDLSTSKHVKLPFNKTMHLIQQGFTADVNCRDKDPRDNATYSPTLQPQRIGTSDLWVNQLTARCPSGGVTTSDQVVYHASDTQNTGGLFGVACPISGTSSYDIIMRATGAYDILDYITCTLTPKTTLVHVAYVNSPQNLEVPTNINVSKPITATDVAGGWGGMAVEMLLYNIVLGQSPRGNTLANAWLLTGVQEANVTLGEAMNTFIRAGIEFTGTAVRQVWTQPDSPIGRAGFASSFYLPIEGTFIASTYGWYQDRTVSPLFALPTTVVILATYGLLIYGLVLARKYEGDLVRGDAHFDPTDIVHVIAAHTPETRQEEFRLFSQGSNSYMRNTSVKMESKSGVRAFQILAKDGNGSDRARQGGRRGSAPGGERNSDDLKQSPDEPVTEKSD